MGLRFKLFISSLCLCTGLSAAPSLVVSNQPLALISQAVVEGVTEPYSILAAEQSPHHVQLRPSQLQQLRGADLVLRIGDELDSYLNSALQPLPAERVLSVMDLELDFRHYEDSHTRDPHVWLSPANILRIAQALTQRLSHLDPEHAANYQHNLSAFTQQLQTLDQQLTPQLASVRSKVMTSHPGYGYFAQYYQLESVALDQADHHHGTSLRHTAALHRQVKAENIRCFLIQLGESERRFAPLMAQVAEAKLAVLDGLGAKASNVNELLQNLAHTWIDCAQ